MSKSLSIEAANALRADVTALMRALFEKHNLAPPAAVHLLVVDETNVVYEFSDEADHNKAIERLLLMAKARLNVVHDKRRQRAAAMPD